MQLIRRLPSITRPLTAAPLRLAAPVSRIPAASRVALKSSLPLASVGVRYFSAASTSKAAIHTPRIADPFSVAPDVFKPLLTLEGLLHKTTLEPSVLELVKIRASQINCCAFCVDMHTADARKRGETERRLFAVSAWHDTPFFTPRERAALAWTEAVTLISSTQAPDADYQALAAQFSEKERVELTMAINAINVWNRISISFRRQPKA